MGKPLLSGASWLFHLAQQAFQGPELLATDEDHALAVAPAGPCACLIAVEHGARWRGLTRVLGAISLTLTCLHFGAPREPLWGKA